MYANIYFNENEFNKKERVDNIKMIETIDNKLIILTEKRWSYKIWYIRYW